jgi:hypothetical protein
MCPKDAWLKLHKPELLAPRNASMRVLISDSVAVNEVARIRPAVTYGLSSGFTNIRCPRWFWR